jgi:hypothetical protein
MHTHAHKNVDRSNRISALLTLACAIHCAAMPMLISVLPLLGLQFLASHLLEGILLAVGIGFGAYGVLRAYFTQHRDIRPVIVLAVGTVLILLGMLVVSHEVEPFLVSIGALCVGAAQLLNIRSCKNCAH